MQRFILSVLCVCVGVLSIYAEETPKQKEKLCQEKKEASFSKIKAIIFDCDGVLINSDYGNYLSWKQALEKQDYHLSLEEYCLIAGKSGEQAAAFFTKKTNKECGDKVLKDKRGYYTKLQVQGFKPVQPTVEFVKLLAERKKELGILLAVASTPAKRIILNNLRHLNIEDCFDLILSGKDDLDEFKDPQGTNKPKPYIYLLAAKKLGITPEECVVIEDSWSGVTASRNAGCYTIAVPTYFTKNHDLSKADQKIESFEGMKIEEFFDSIEKAKEKQ